MDKLDQARRARVLAGTLFAAAFYFVMCRVHVLRVYGAGAFWDAQIYARALSLAAMGMSPYGMDSGHHLSFVYPPVFVKVGVALASVMGSAGWFVYLALLAVAMMAIPLLTLTEFIRSPVLTPARGLWLFVLIPMYEAEGVFVTGNISSLLYAAALVAGVPGVRRHHWGWFYVAVFGAALVKPTFLALLILPALEDAGEWVRSVGVVAAVGLAYGAQRLLFPELYAGFQEAVWSQVAVRRDIGVGLFFAFERVTHLLGGVRDEYLLLLHAALLGVVVVFLYRNRGLREQATVRMIWQPLLLLSALLANPRLQGYDSVVAMLPATYLYGIVAWKQPRGWRRWVAIAVPLLLVAFALVKVSVAGLLFLLGAEVAGLWMVWAAAAAQLGATDERRESFS